MSRLINVNNFKFILNKCIILLNSNILETSYVKYNISNFTNNEKKFSICNFSNYSIQIIDFAGILKIQKYNAINSKNKLFIMQYISDSIALSKF